MLRRPQHLRLALVADAVHLAAVGVAGCLRVRDAPRLLRRSLGAVLCLAGSDACGGLKTLRLQRGVQAVHELVRRALRGQPALGELLLHGLRVPRVGTSHMHRAAVPGVEQAHKAGVALGLHLPLLLLLAPVDAGRHARQLISERLQRLLLLGWRRPRHRGVQATDDELLDELDDEVAALLADEVAAAQVHDMGEQHVARCRHDVFQRRDTAGRVGLLAAPIRFDLTGVGRQHEGVLRGTQQHHRHAEGRQLLPDAVGAADAVG